MVLGRIVKSDPGLILSYGSNILTMWCFHGDILTSLSINHISHKIEIKVILYRVAKEPWEILFLKLFGNCKTFYSIHYFSYQYWLANKKL